MENSLHGIWLIVRASHTLQYCLLPQLTSPSILSSWRNNQQRTGPYHSRSHSRRPRRTNHTPRLWPLVRRPYSFPRPDRRIRPLPKPEDRDTTRTRWTQSVVCCSVGQWTCCCNRRGWWMAGQCVGSFCYPVCCRLSSA